MKSIVVFGCGRFGSTVATTLTSLGHEVLVVDTDFEKVQGISDEVTTSVQCDILDEEAVKDLGLSNFDNAVIAIGTNLEAAIMATILCKEAGVSYIVAKAMSLRKGEILKKVGADKLIYPERDMGFRLAHSLDSNNILDFIQLSPEYSIIEIKVLEKWVGKSIEELNFRDKYKATILGIERDKDIEIIPGANEKLFEDDVLIVLGKDEILHNIEK